MKLPQFFQQHIDAKKAERHSLARVISVHKDSFMIRKVATNDVYSEHTITDVFAELAGNLFYSAESPSDLPTTGDWVYCDFYDEDSHAIIHGVVPRKSLIKRKSVSKSVENQLIAANIDVAFIMQSANDNFNLRRLERYLVMVRDSNIEPIIILSKCDLVSAQTLTQMTLDIRTVAPDNKVIVLSSIEGTNLDSLTSELRSGHSYCLLGSSGVGKTTLLNSLIGDDIFDTKTVSKKESKGRHTTTSRELVLLENGAMIIDTPGMRELGNFAVDEALDETFSEVTALVQQCKFGNCSHTNEKGCAITAALASGELSLDRLQNYQKMKSESDFYAMSYHEKRKKDKDFGKLIKATLKGKRR